MATQRRFEGDTLAEVLAKVQQEVGSDAKIASAQKVRTGGAFGFFQKERFEVLVDIPDVVVKPAAAPVAPPTTPVAPAARPTATASAAGGATDRAEWLASLHPDAKSTIRSESEEEEPFTPASLLELAQQINQEERSKEKTVSTESNAFAEVLSRVAYQADMQSTPPAATSPALNDVPVRSSLHRSGRSGTPAPEDAATPPIEGRPAFLDEPKPQAKPAPVASQPPIDPTPIDPDPATPDPVPLPEPQPAITATATPEPHSVPAQALPAAPLSGSSAATAVQLAAREASSAPAMRTRVTDHPLANLGLPAPYIPADVFETSDVVDLRTRLVETLTERLPRTPVVRPSRGSIIAVVGQRDEAQKIALDIAREFGRPKEEIAFASQHAKGKLADGIVTSVENAEDAQRSWSRRKRITIVTIEARPGSTDTAWAEHVLTALEPIATFGVVDAARKAEDIASWADALGGVDCLAINNIEETVSPASVLQAGIPVERIDGRKATPEYWALLLTERLPAA